MCDGILTRNNHNKKEIVREKGTRGKKRRGGREYKGGKWTRDKVCGRRRDGEGWWWWWEGKGEEKGEEVDWKG